MDTQHIEAINHRKDRSCIGENSRDVTEPHIRLIRWSLELSFEELIPSK